MEERFPSVGFFCTRKMARDRALRLYGVPPQQCALFALPRCSSIQVHLPADTPLVGWQSEGQRFMMGGQEH
jgi:hypothetical protein